MVKKLSAVMVFFCLITAAFISSLSSQPSFNGSAPGCGTAPDCHTPTPGILSVALLDSLRVEITLSGTTSNVAGELVDSAGIVVAVNDRSGSNPFVLRAPGVGRFTVNAG